MTVEVVLLGTGTPIPNPDRAGPSNLVRTGDAAVLVDCGRGALMRLAGAGVLPPALTAVALTHLHSDHISDLNDLVTSHWVMLPEPAPLHVIGPVGTTRMIEGLLAMLAQDIRYRMDHHEFLGAAPDVVVTELEPGDRIDLGDTAVIVDETCHPPVAPTLGYRFEHGGNSAVLAGDTIPCAGLDRLCQAADLYVQTVIRPDLMHVFPDRARQDIIDYHSSVTDAADTATRAGVGTLVLTHYLPGMIPGQEDEWRAIAAERFDGPIVLGDDLTTARAG